MAAWVTNEKRGTALPVCAAMYCSDSLTIERRLQHIHEHRVMHRDIKPANIFIASQCIKLGDLGLGRSLNTDSQEAFSKVRAPCICCAAPDRRPDSFVFGQVGTPLYMSPEVLHGQARAGHAYQFVLRCSSEVATK